MKLFLKFGLATVWGSLLALYFGGCVKIDSPNAPPVDIRSIARIVNLERSGAQASVAIDGGSIGNVNYQAATTYMNLPAGQRFFNLTIGATLDTFHLALPSDTKVTLYCVYDPASGGSPSHILDYERTTYAGIPAIVSGAVLLRFIDLTSDTSYTGPTGAEFHVLTGPRADTIAVDSVQSGIAFGIGTPYVQASLTSFPRIELLSSRGDTLMRPTVVSATAGRFSMVLFGASSAGSITTKIFQED